MSTAKYYDSVFPHKLMELAFPMAPVGTHSLKVQISDTKDGLPNQQWVPLKSHSQFMMEYVRGTRHTTPNTKHALHVLSPFEKLFVLDLDLDLFKDPYKSCVKNNHAAGELICPLCWRQILFAARAYAEALENITKFIMSTQDQTTERWTPPLFCFSGRRGIHVYCHRGSKLQFLPAASRKAILEKLAHDWIKWAPRAAELARQTTDCTIWALDASPIDFEASFTVQGKTTRMPFSAHVDTDYVCTPFDHVRDELPARHYAIKWNATPAEWEECTVKRTAVAFEVFEKWIHGVN